MIQTLGTLAALEEVLFGLLSSFAFVGLEVGPADIGDHLALEFEEGEEVLLGVELVVERVEDRLVLLEGLVAVAGIGAQHDSGVVAVGRGEGALGEGLRAADAGVGGRADD